MQQSSTPDEIDVNAFMTNLRDANAEDLKQRILAGVKTNLEAQGQAAKILKSVQIDVSDFTKPPTPKN